MGADLSGSLRAGLETRVIVIPPTRADGAAIGKLLVGAGVSYDLVADMTQLCGAIEVGAACVVLSEEAVLNDPQPLIEHISHQPLWSDLPIIILSREGQESGAFPTVIAQLGNVSVVERPVRTFTFLTLIRASRRTRARQYELRQFLTDQEQAQIAIRAGERRYRSLIDNVTDYAIFMTDSAGRIMSWNNGAQAVLGYSSEEVSGRSTELFASRDTTAGQAIEAELTEARRAGRSKSTGWKTRKDGKRLYVEGVVVVVRDDHDEVTGFAYFLRDITEKHLIEIDREQLLTSERAARTQAEHTSRMKDEFLATLSHELRTPLNAVLGWTQVLRKSPDLSQDVMQGLSTIERNARAQAQIIEDLLDMSSIISGKIRLDVQRVDLAAVVNATVETVRPAAQARGIRLQVVLDPLAGPVRGDPNRLQQILWNLLTNAVKFTSREGRVTVTLARINSHLEIEVTDTGEGIAPDFLPHVFDRFRQADASSARRHGGLGLGLSIVKQLVELHGGTITAKSPGRGAGATFRVALPLMPMNGETTKPTQARQYTKQSVEPTTIEELEPVNLAGIFVLVVDDEADSRTLIQRVLQECGAEVILAASADEALGQFALRSPDVLVSDVGMPDQDGYALIQRIRTSESSSAQVPAIALTAYARIEDRLRAIRAGFQLHLSKPVEPIELVSMIHSLVRRS